MSDRDVKRLAALGIGEPIREEKLPPKKVVKKKAPKKKKKIEICDMCGEETTDYVYDYDVGDYVCRSCHALSTRRRPA